MSDTGGAATEEERQLVARLRPIVTIWLVLAVVVIAVVVVATPRPRIDAAVIAWSALLLGLVIATGLIDFPLYVGRVKESVGLGELGLLPAILLLEPTAAIVVAGLGQLVVEVVLTRGYPQRVAKVTFNLSSILVSVALGSWLHHSLVGAGLPLTILSLVAAMAVALLDLVINAAAMGSIHAVAYRQPWADAVRGLFGLHVAASLAAGFTGILLAVLFVAAPVAVPLVLVPILIYRRSARDRTASEREVRLERDRFERTVAGASDGVVLLDPEGRIEVWSPVMADLSGVPGGDALGRQLGDLGWSALLASGPGTGPRRIPVGDLVVEVRRSDLADGAGTVLLVQDVRREAELARIREDLVSRISHELRTPLTTVEGFMETLDARWDALGEEERRRLVAVTRAGAHRLSRLVDKLLVWSGIEAREPHAAREDGGIPTGDPVAVLERFGAAYDDVELEELEELEAAAADDGRLAVAMSDGDLDLVVEQLVENARTYGGAPVVLGLVREGQFVHLQVTDHGDGLPEAFVPDAFQPFRQGVEGLQRTARGLGLGLAIVHSLASGVGGEVRVEQPASAGTRFTVSLPRVAP